jgi:phospholipase/carboxylesterase
MINNENISNIEINPLSKPEHSIIWMHGLGADGNDFAPIVPELGLAPSLNTRFVFPHAPIMPVTVNNGYQMRAWFDIYGRDLGTKVDLAGIEQSVKTIHSLIQAEEKLGIPAENIMLAGFSQGCVIALTAGLLYPQRLAGIIALSGLLPNAGTLIQQGAPANHDIPIFIAHGNADQVVPFALGRDAWQALTKAGYKASWHEYPMAHSVCGQEIKEISEWIKNIWS